MPTRIHITDGSSGTLPIGAISASGIPSSTTYLRGDGTWSTAGGGSPGGPSGSIQINGSGSFTGTSNLTWNNSGNQLNLSGTGNTINFVPNSVDPTVDAGKVAIFARNVGGREIPKFIQSDGVDHYFQPAIFNNKIGWWNPPGGATTLPGVLGMAAITTSSSVSAITPVTTNLFTRTRRFGIGSGVISGSAASFFHPTAMWTMGSGGLGGFFLHMRFGCADAVSHASGVRGFFGIGSGVLGPTNVEPSTVLNQIGIGYGAADTNFKVYYGGSSTASAIDLGANFPCNTQSTDMYEIYIHSSTSGSGTSVGYRVVRHGTSFSATGTLTSSIAGQYLPLATTYLAPRGYRYTNNTSAVSIHLASIYIESDY
jgi:hypothetical protein